MKQNVICVNVFMNIQSFFVFCDWILALREWVKAQFVCANMSFKVPSDSPKSIVQTIEKVGTIYLLKPRLVSRDASYLIKSLCSKLKQKTEMNKSVCICFDRNMKLNGSYRASPLIS